VPEENFWTLWCKGRLTEANTPTIRLEARRARGEREGRRGGKEGM